MRTAPGSYDEALAVAEAELGPEVVAAALRIADSVAGEATGPRPASCATGCARPARRRSSTCSSELRGWLAANPDEVVTLFIEDHVDAALIAADIEAAGLLPLVYEPIAGRTVADARRDDPLRQAPRRHGRGGRRR